MFWNVRSRYFIFENKDSGKQSCFFVDFSFVQKKKSRENEYLIYVVEPNKLLLWTYINWHLNIRRKTKDEENNHTN